MKLVEETKTYEIPLDEMVEFPNVPAVVGTTIASMPEWGLVGYAFNNDTWSLSLTVRRRF